MIEIRNESDFRNWFKENYRKLGFSKIIESSTKGFPDFVMLENGKNVRVELETKSSNFKLHEHPSDKIDKVICITEDVRLNVPTIKIEGIKLATDDMDSLYSIKRQVYSLFGKTNVPKVLTTTEVASLADVHWNTAEKALLELAIDGKVERMKKAGVNLWVIK